MLSDFQPTSQLPLGEFNLVTFIVVLTCQNSLEKSVHIEYLLAGDRWIVEEMVDNGLFDSSWFIVVDKIDEFN